MRLKPIEPSILSKGAALQSIVPRLEKSTRRLLNIEKLTSEAFEYPVYRGKDYTLGQHSLERHEQMERKRSLLREFMR
jgi:hypothetical protein